MSGQDEILNVAVIGSGPAGYYTADALAQAERPVAIDIIDRLPTPYGLIRAGVAPDHQSIKQVARRYAETAHRPAVHFIGNVEVGRDVSVAELLELYDAVVLATGAPADRRLGIPGEDLDGVVGSGAFVGWYNAHPDYVGLDLDLDAGAVAVIGNGNVALDVARVLAKTAAEMEHSDLAAHAAEKIHRAPMQDIFIFGRRGPLEARFTPKELGELGRLERCVPLVDYHDLPPPDAAKSGGRRKLLARLWDYAENDPNDKPVRLHLRFYARPVQVRGTTRAEALELERTRVEAGQVTGTGEILTVPCDLVVTCIGYRTAPLGNLPYDRRHGHYRSADGRVADRLYAVGWAKRGPVGTIATNKPDGREAAARILAEATPAGRAGRRGLDRLIAGRGIETVSFRDWERIDAAETRAAAGLQPRRKFARIDQMLDAARGSGQTVNPSGGPARK